MVAKSYLTMITKWRRSTFILNNFALTILFTNSFINSESFKNYFVKETTLTSSFFLKNFPPNIEKRTIPRVLNATKENVSSPTTAKGQMVLSTAINYE